VDGDAAMSLGSFDYGWWSRLVLRFPPITGERIIPRWVFEAIPPASRGGFAIEIMIDEVVCARRLPVVARVMVGVTHRTKREKFGKLETGSVSTLSGHAAAVASPKDEVPGAVVGAAAPRDGSLSIDNSHQGNNNNNNPADDGNASKKKRGFVEEVRRTFWMVVTYSWLNVLLVFVPIGIVVANVPGVHGGIVFAMNCIAVIPLAGLLSFATESVASNMGDSLGALLNVTFGNAVELIIL